MHSVPHNKQPGLTMVEIMVAAAISMLVFAMAFTAMVQFCRVHYSLAIQADMDREFRYAINLMTDDFRGLSSIDIEELTDSEIEDGKLPKVIITLPNVANSDGVMPIRTEVSYSVGDDTVIRRVYAEYDHQELILETRSTRLIQNVSNFTVARVPGTPSFDLTLTTVRQAGGSGYEKTMTTRVSSRN